MSEATVQQTTAVQPPRYDEQFQDFLRTFRTEDGKFKYRTRLGQAARQNTRSLVVDFDELVSHNPNMARDVLSKPVEVLDELNRAAWAQLKIEDPEYADDIKKLHVRLRKLLDRTAIRKIGAENVACLLAVDGIIVRSTGVKPLMLKAAFQCRKCNAMTYVDQVGMLMRGPGVCGHCRSRIFELIEKESTYINFQEIRIQERPEDIPAGQLPRTINVKTTEDLVDVARPGDRVTVTGIVKAQQDFIGKKTRLRTFELELDANYIDIVGKEIDIVEITPEEEHQIRELSKDPFLQRKLISSLAPSIYGYGDIKEAVLYLLFGGVHKRLPDGMNIRGEINTLIVGDPGTAKSQLLQYVTRTAPRGLYTSGRGTSAAGLTAAVLRDKNGGMILEAGALVLADKGTCCIDEMDKMRPEDRIAIHEALEQHTVSIAKGGIVATLNARAAVLAAANPTMGRYDPYRNITDNINMPVTLLSRFDLVFVMRDVPDKDQDEQMAKHILTLHKTKASPETPPLTTDFLRKYIAFAKHIEPVLSEDASNMLWEYYVKMRTASSSTESPVAITPRQLESLVRLSEARAKLFLRETVTVEDASTVIRLMSLYMQEVGIDTTTGKIDIDVIMTGKPKSLRDKMDIVLGAFSDLEKQLGTVLEDATLYQAVSRKAQITEDEARRLVESLLKDGILYSPKPGHLRRTAGS